MKLDVQATKEIVEVFLTVPDNPAYNLNPQIIEIIRPTLNVITVGELVLTSGNVARFTHIQGTLSDEWIVNHNFGYEPQVEVLSVGGVALGCVWTHFSVNQVRVYFNTPQVGRVNCI